jgi:hypothetical protein
MSLYNAEVTNCEARPLWGVRVDCMRDMFISREIWVQGKIYILIGTLFAWFKYFTYRLVQLVAPNYKQHILSPAKVRRVLRYSLAELYVKSV